MAKAKQRKLNPNFKKVTMQKFKEYDQKLKALSKINVPEAIEEYVQAKVILEMKKKLPTHVPNPLANFVMPRLNNTVLDDPPNNREGEKRRKRRKDAGESSSKSSKKDKASMDSTHDDILVDQPHDPVEELIKNILIQNGRIQALEHERWDLDVEIKQIKDLKASYGITIPQELRRNQIKEDMSQHHDYGITA
ncbi:hypothetical protein Tco_0093699 [Tanacetum coccineum]